MNENRKQILEMLAAGKITADEAERLIAAMEHEPGAAAAGDGTAKPRAKYLHVTVDAESYPGKPPTKVNIRVPMQLLRSGVRLAGLIPLQARTHVEEAMRQKGIDIDLSQIRPENLEEIVDQLQDITVDVDDDKAKVRVYAE
jgi:hypothetical protein